LPRAIKVGANIAHKKLDALILSYIYKQMNFVEEGK
jgi:hypothetical protein